MFLFCCFISSATIKDIHATVSQLCLIIPSRTWRKCNWKSCGHFQSHG